MAQNHLEVPPKLPMKPNQKKGGNLQNGDATLQNRDVSLQNGDVREVKMAVQEDDIKYGVGKEELMRSAKDPFWVGVRWFLFIMFWIIWVAMIVISVVIVVYAPKCPAPPPRTWWQKGVIQKADVQKMKDGDGDGVGDLKGITETVGHLKDPMDVDVMWLTSLFDPLMKHDVTGHMKLKDAVGSIDEFDKLLDTLQDKDIKLIVDFISTYTSNQHPWFIESEHRQKEYDHFYVWKEQNERQRESSGSWAYSSKRKAFYLYNQRTQNAVLNLQYQPVIDKIKEALKYWLDKGVEGFVMDNSPLLDEPIYGEEGEDTMEVDADNKTNKDTALRQIRQLIDEYEDERILLLESSGDMSSSELSHILVDSELFNEKSLKDGFTGYSLDDNVVNRLLKPVNPDHWPGWRIQESVKSQITATYGDSLVDVMNMLLMILPGTPIINYGDQMGYTQTLQPGLHFGETKPKETKSHLEIFEDLLKLRDMKALLYGDADVPVIDKNIFSLTRVVKGAPGVGLVINFSNETRVIDLSEASTVPKEVTLYLPRKGGASRPMLSSSSLTVQPRQGIVITFVPVIES